MSDLGTLPGGNDAVAYGVNNVGQVVGTSNTAPGSAYAHAFLWQNSQIIDLNTLIPSNSGWVLTCATDVNDKGQIVGMGNTNGQLHGFLLTPQ